MVTPSEKSPPGEAIEEIEIHHSKALPTNGTSTDVKSAHVGSAEIKPDDGLLITPSKPANSGSASGASSAASTKSSKSEPAEEARRVNIDNPLAVLTSPQLYVKIDEFIDLAGDLRTSRVLLQRGGELVRDKDDALDNDTALSPEQKDYLKDLEQPCELEHHKLREKSTGVGGQSKFLKGSLWSACLAGIVQGWTQSVINGANIGMPIDLEIHHRPDDPLRNTKDRWLFGVLTAIPFLAGGLIVPFFSDPLQDYFFGRRGAIAIACGVSIAATIGQAFSTNVAQLLGCRLLTGITLAAKASAAPLLIAEISPDHLRGNLLSSWQLSDAFGIFLGFASNLAALNISASPKVIWRIQTITVLIPTTALLVMIYLMPESPRYLMKRGEYARSLESFTYLRPAPVSSLLAARDLVYAHFQLEAEHQFMEDEKKSREERKANKEKGEGNKKNGTASRDMATRLGTSARPGIEPARDDTKRTASYAISRTLPHQRFAQTFRDPRSRRALVCASTAMIAQQLTGINTIAFLSASLLSDRGASDRQGAWVGFGIGICNFICGLPAFWYLDKIGRANLLLLGFPPMFVLLLITALVSQVSEDSGRLPLVSVFGVLYVIAYSPTAGTSPFAISAEVFPLVIREVGHSLAVGVNFVGLGIVLVVFPILSDAMGGYAASLSLFACLNIVAFVLCFLFVPETKDRNIDELQYTFDLSTRKHIEYRWKVATPWTIKKYLGPMAVRVGLWKQEELDKIGILVPFHRWGRGV